MKTLADFKRAMTLGSVWLRKHVNEKEFVERTVVKVCSNHVYVAGGDTSEKGAVLDFPKASDFEINENGDAEIYWPALEMNCTSLPRRLVLTYRKVEK